MSAVGAIAAVPPLAAPVGLLAEVFVPQPEAVWQRAQPWLTRALGFRPPSFAALASELFGIPAAYAPAVTLGRPVTGVLIDANPPRAVLALPLASGRELVAALTTGQQASHRAALAAGGVVVVLEPRQAAPRRLHLGVLGNSLLVGARSEDLMRYGPYAVQVLRERAMPPGPIELRVPRAVLGSTVGRRLTEGWRAARERLEQLARQSRAEHGGRNADFAEPTAVLQAIDGLVVRGGAWLSSAESLRVILDVGAERVVVEGQLIPLPAGAARELVDRLVVGDAGPLLTLPSGVRAGITWRSSLASRERAATTLHGGLDQLFGARLQATDRVLLARAIDAATRAAGDRFALGWVGDERGSGWVAQLDSSEAAALDEALRALLRTTDTAVVRAPLAAHLGDPAVALDRPLVAGVGAAATRARLVFVPRRGAGSRRTHEIWWRTEGARGHVAGGAMAGDLLRRSLTADAVPSASLASDPRVVAAVTRAGREIALAILVDPRGFGTEPGSSAAALAPLFITVGREEGSLRVRLEADVLPTAGLLGALLTDLRAP